MLCYARRNGRRIEIVTNPAGHCCTCSAEGKLTWHHVFGKSAKIVMRLCLDCHRSYHHELDVLDPGDLTRIVLDVFVSSMWPIQSGYALSSGSRFS